MPEEAAVEQPKATETPAPATPEVPAGAIVADQPKEQSGFRRYNAETQSYETLSTEIGDEPPKAEEKPVEAKTEEPPKTDEPPKLIFGKYKSLEEAERAHKDLERKFHEERQQIAKEEKAKTDTAVEGAAKDTAKEVTNTVPQYADLLLTSPEEFENKVFERIDQRMKTHAQVQEIQADWKKTNPDLVGMEEYVSAELKQILASHPEKQKEDLQTLLNEATGNLRVRLQPIVDQAERRAMTVRTTVQPLGVTSAARKDEHTPADKGAPSGDALAEELAARRTNLSRVTGSRPAR